MSVIAPILVYSIVSLGQEASPKAAPPITKELPVILEQKIEAGKTPAGTKVRARLVVATLIQGVVFPRNSELSGEVIISEAPGGGTPSRLSLRMNVVRWREKSAAIAADLTGWIYPPAANAPQDLSYRPPDEANSPKNWNGGGAYPDPNNPVSQQKFPGRETRETDAQAAAPASQISKHRVRMKGVQEAAATGYGLVLTATKFTIKLDKLTTYVFAEP